MRILLLEDVGRSASTVAEQLEKAGHSVDLGFTVSRANGYLQERGNYDCLVVDFNMETTGLTKAQAAQTHSGLFTGWIWLRDQVFRDYPHLRPRTVILSAYLDDFREQMPDEDVEGIVMIAKGEAREADEGLQEDKLMSAVEDIARNLE
jgi:CheY-like chemotaxis protein